ncbi:MAG: chemotaxis protein CheW [Campylobacterales bacterium]|nr:chemotaxis protein CheW [Campylobacterales bacterium]
MDKLEQVLIFKVDECLYCVDSSQIVQILRVPQLTAIPFTPKCLRGLCSIEGQIVPAFDVENLIIKNKNVDLNNYKSRVLTIKNEEQNIAFIVQEVVSNVSVEDREIEYDNNSEDCIIGVIKLDEDIVQIVSIDKLISNIALPEYVKRYLKPNARVQDIQLHVSHNYKKYLLFEMENEKFAIETDMIREVIVNTNDITSIANAPREVIGMIKLRDEIIVALDLRKNFNKQPKLSDKNRILIVQHENHTIGLLIDNILDIKDIDNDEIEALPEKFRDRKIQGVININKSIISVLNNSYLKDLITSSNKHYDTKETSKKSIHIVDKYEHEESIEVAIFTLEKEEFAINIEDLDEIIKYDKITPMPQTADYLKGIINLRGEVIPVVSLQKKLNFNEFVNDDTKILVCRLFEQKVGFLVDNISEVREIYLDNISKNESSNPVFSEILVLENGKRMVLKISLKHLFSKEELKAIQTESNN